MAPRVLCYLCVTYAAFNNKFRERLLVESPVYSREAIDAGALVDFSAQFLAIKLAGVFDQARRR